MLKSFRDYNNAVLELELEYNVAKQFTHYKENSLKTEVDFDVESKMMRDILCRYSETIWRARDIRFYTGPQYTCYADKKISDF